MLTGDIKGRACMRGTRGLIGLRRVLFGVLLHENWFLFFSFFSFDQERWRQDQGGSREGELQAVVIPLAFFLLKSLPSLLL
jgi:hypothetical protein